MADFEQVSICWDIQTCTFRVGELTSVVAVLYGTKAMIDATSNLQIYIQKKLRLKIRDRHLTCMTANKCLYVHGQLDSIEDNLLSSPAIT